MSLRLLIIGLVLSLPASVFAGGGWSGTGGGIKTSDQLNPWFLGERPIEYCIISTNSTAPMEPALDIMIRKNSQRWQDFFTRYGFDKNGFGSNYRKFPDGTMKSIATQFVPAQDCQVVKSVCSPGNTKSDQCYEALLNKVLFMFGDPNDIIQDYLRTNGPMDGLAIRTDYNHSTYRSGGIVWINNLANGGWSMYGHLLLHEMGHIAGMRHDSCWVMAENVISLLNSFNGIGELQSIEAPNWPYSFKDQDRLIFTDSRISVGNGPLGYYPNLFLKYQGLLEILNFGENNRFQVRGTVTGSTSSQSIGIKIEIEEFETHKVEVLQGHLFAKSSFGSSNAPQLYTLWKGEGGPTIPPRLGLDFLTSGWVAQKLHGILDWNGKKVAVDLDRDRGMILSLFFPGAKNYLTLATVLPSPSKLPRRK